MPKQTQSWASSESLRIVGIVIAATLIVFISQGKGDLGGYVAGALALLGGIWRIIKGKDQK